jgi:peptide methionine sulfoxide reductase MsrB
MTKTKTNINLIVNGIKVYTRKTTGKPYTHALVAQNADGKFQITNCSAKGPESLYDSDTRKWSVAVRDLTNPTWFVLPIIDNTVTLAV